MCRKSSGFITVMFILKIQLILVQVFMYASYNLFLIFITLNGLISFKARFILKQSTKPHQSDAVCSTCYTEKSVFVE